MNPQPDERFEETPEPDFWPWVEQLVARMLAVILVGVFLGAIVVAIQMLVLGMTLQQSLDTMIPVVIGFAGSIIMMLYYGIQNLAEAISD